MCSLGKYLKYDSHFNNFEGVAVQQQQPPMSRSVICLFAPSPELQSSPDVDRDRSTVANKEEEEKRSCVKGSLTRLSQSLSSIDFVCCLFDSRY